MSAEPSTATSQTPVAGSRVGRKHWRVAVACAALTTCAAAFGQKPPASAVLPGVVPAQAAGREPASDEFRPTRSPAELDRLRAWVGPTDPLRVSPARLSSPSATLPGDAAPRACPDLIGFSSAPLTLDKVIAMALCSNADIRSAWAAIAESAGAVGEARAAFYPKVNASYGGNRTLTHSADTFAADSALSGPTGSLSLNWRLYDFGARAAGRDAARYALDAAIADYDATQQKVLHSVIGDYFNALVAQAALQVRTQATEIALETEAATRRRRIAGAAARSDTLQATVASTRAKLALQRATADLQRALTTLRLDLNLPMDTPLDVPGHQDEPEAVGVRELSDWLDQASSQHPAIVSATAQHEATANRMLATHRSSLPTVDLQAGYTVNALSGQALQSTKSHVLSAGITLNIPLFEGFAGGYRDMQAEAQLRKSRAQLDATRARILGEIVKAHADTVSSRANLGVSRELSSAAHEALQSARRRYDNGAADITELLSSQGAALDAEQERVRCLAEWQAARLQLLAAAGLLSQAQLDSDR